MCSSRKLQETDWPLRFQFQMLERPPWLRPPRIRWTWGVLIAGEHAMEGNERITKLYRLKKEKDEKKEGKGKTEGNRTKMGNL